MTPKEKATELIETFSFWNTSQGERDAMRGALLCVEEILKVNRTSFWESVKHELLNYEYE